MATARTRRATIVLALLCVQSIGHSQSSNPIVPPGTYIADPSAHVWNDGKLYVYGSRDESPDYYCSWDHSVLSSDDLTHWEVTPNAFASRGAHDEVPYSDQPLYAPDCQYQDGTYYLYYCLASTTDTEGVATSSSPTGPFKNSQVIELDGIDQIDPAVFIDDDGQAYYIWGQFTAKMAKLRDNMTEVDVDTIRDDVLTEEEHFFHEGGFIVKRRGIYYFVYAHMGRAGMPTCIAYATSDSPMGPYAYGGVIVDNDHCDPGNWNNHGSIVEFEGQWYVFYHRSTHGCKTMRKVCVEPIFFNEDGSIDEVEMTSQGAGDPLDARSRIEAERACLLYGNARVQAFTKDQDELGRIGPGDKAAYKYLDFGAGVTQISLRVAPGSEPAQIDVALDRSWGPSVGSLEIAGGGDGRTWTTVTGEIKPTAGVHALWLRFRGGDTDYAIDWLTFTSQADGK